MQIHELPDVTAIGSGGYFATDNGSQTTKIDYDALAKAIIEQYSGSTLAGAAQSVKTALDGLDGNKLDLKAGTAITNGTDVNTLQTPGTYFCASASIAASLSNIPTQAATVGFRMDVARNGYNADNYLTQTLRAVSSGAAFEYVRGMSTEGTWGAWQKVPTRAEVDALNSNIYTEINTGIASSYGTLQYKCYKTGHIVGFAGQLVLTSDCPVFVDIITGLPTLGTVITNYSPVRMFNNTAAQYVDMSLHRTGTGATSTLSIYTRSALSSGASLRFNFTYCCE